MPIEVANLLSTIGLFFGGLGLLFLSFGFWGLFPYTQKVKSQNKRKRNNLVQYSPFDT